MRGLLRMMKARTLEEIAQALALIRPGAAEYGSKELFVKRLRGEEEVKYAHPALESILSDSRGVCIFQEQVMQISQALGICRWPKPIWCGGRLQNIPAGVTWTDCAENSCKPQE